MVRFPRFKPSFGSSLEKPQVKYSFIAIKNIPILQIDALIITIWFFFIIWYGFPFARDHGFCLRAKCL
ncbi:hypothetical protein Anas_08502 [Armadillidium nasatum]|uniref:Uncharacterized protein n=1 Tax=Armadillidium nasatum TaxID=96803 RepID=A0A5N5T7Q0_9CRUS|nr:hypothetical protein Anas_08502 [Armadillidium nasatum]